MPQTKEQTRFGKTGQGSGRSKPVLTEGKKGDKNGGSLQGKK